MKRISKRPSISNDSREGSKRTSDYSHKTRGTLSAYCRVKAPSDNGLLAGKRNISDKF